MEYKIGKSWEELGIKVPPQKEHHEGWIKTKCPNCRDIGKTNFKDLCLGVKPANGYGICHKCNLQYIVDNKEPVKKDYTLPTLPNKTNLSREALQFFVDRMISQEVVNRMGITGGRGSVIFPYYKRGVLTKYKARGIAEKKFFQSKDSEPIIYNYDGCIGKKNIAICEGEADQMAILTAFEGNQTFEEEFGVTSVDQGAPNPSDKNYDGKLACIDNCIEIFEEAEVIYIAVDNDANGSVLKDYIVKRFGHSKCKIVDWGKYKDANEFLMYEGKDALVERVSEAEYPKVSGVFQLKDVWKEIENFYDFGLQKGSTTHMKSIDPHWTWRHGEVNVWTGFNNEGKSLILTYLNYLKARFDGQKSAFFSSENMPVANFYEDLVHMHIGKSLDRDVFDRASKKDLQESKDFIDSHFYVNYPQGAYSLESILEGFEFLVVRKGVKSVVLDPYNNIKHNMKSGERDDQYIARFMPTLKRFAIDHNVSVHLVAHQNKPERDNNENFKKPSLYSIKTGGSMSDMADNVLCIHRPFRATEPNNIITDFYADKIKKRKLTGDPGCNREIGNIIIFDYKSNRYKECLNFQGDIYSNEDLLSQAIDPLENFKSSKEEKEFDLF